MSFSKDISNFSKKAERNTLKLFISVSFDIFGRVVKRTPVDTGRLRNNWQITPNIVLGKTVLISNNMPYAKRIEDGYSQQAPSGMVKVTVNEFDSIVGRFIRTAR